MKKAYTYPSALSGTFYMYSLSPFFALLLLRERMEAMEKQIASLTGLVQSALMRSSDGETPR